MALKKSEVSEEILARRFKRWLSGCGWRRHLHQLEMLTVAVVGRSSLLIAPIGVRKTIADFLSALNELAHGRRTGSDLHTLHILPLSALHRIRSAKKIRDIG